MDERADPDLRRLLFQLEMDREFWFALVVSDDPDDRSPFRDRARAWCIEHAVPFRERFVDLASPRDLAVELARSTTDGVHWVRARDETLPLNTLDRMLVQLLAAMNERRDAYRRHLRGPVVLEGPARLRRSLRTMAPDLFSITSFIAEGSGPEASPHASAFFDEVERVDQIRRSIREDRSRVSVIRGSGTFDRYLTAVPENRRRALEVVAAHSTTPTLGELDEFVARVVVPQREQHRWILATVVYQGRQPDAATLAHAQELDVELESFKTFRRLVDFSRYQSKLRAELSNENDLRYAPRRYVAQRLTWALGRDSQSREDALAEMLDQVSVPEGRLLLILGDFGTGKTFLMRQLALKLASDGGPVPLMVNLRLLNKTHDLDVLLAQHLAQQGERNINLDALHYMMDAGDVVLLFDGFDELALRVTFDRAAEHLATLTSAVRGACRVVVTSRTQHFRNADQSRTVLAQKLDGVSHQVFNLERFDERRIRLFLRDHLAHPLRDDVAPVAEDQLDAEVNRRYALLRDIKDLGGLAETPRMLGMILEIPVADLQAVKDRAGTITAAELYQSLLTRWLTYEWERSNPVGEAPGLPVEARWRFVTRFAKRLWLQTDAGLPEEAVADEVTTVVREMKLKIDPAVATHEAASSTLLRRNAEERYAFLHQSVLEYLVAREAVAVVKTPGEVGLLDEGELSVLMARFLVEQAGAEVIVRWAESVPAGAERARANATRLQTMVADEFIKVLDLHGQDLRGQDLSALKTKRART